ncbi:hypothetical protein Tco_0050108 [Tanacetum coccineum]
MEEFSMVSCLVPNHGKSTIFFGSINNGEKQELIDVLPFKCRRLSVRYLGVPILDKRLGVKDCKALIDKVERESAQGKSKVAWKLVCRPKEQGGLGINP